MADKRKQDAWATGPGKKGRAIAWHLEMCQQDASPGAVCLWADVLCVAEKYPLQINFMQCLPCKPARGRGALPASNWESRAFLSPSPAPVVTKKQDISKCLTQSCHSHIWYEVVEITWDSRWISTLSESSLQQRSNVLTCPLATSSKSRSRQPLWCLRS